MIHKGIKAAKQVRFKMPPLTTSYQHQAFNI